MANEVATAWVSVVPTAKGFGRSLDGQVSGETTSAGKRLGGSFGKAFAAGGAVAAAAGLGTFFSGAISGASDLQEATSKNAVVFGDAADEVLKFADAGAKAFGQTKNDVLAAASTFGTFGKAAGLSGQDLSKFSTDFVSLSSDLASFHNSTPEEAVEALGAALRGEAEPMRRFGVLLDDASLRAEALKQGLISSTKDALTPQQKTLAAQALIMKQTKDAQGDFARTSDGLANSQRILSASFGDLQTKVGTAFLPVVTAAVQGAIFLVDKVSALGPQVSAVGSFLSTALAPVLPMLQTLGASIATTLGPVLTNVATTFQTSILPAVQSLGTYFVTNLLPILAQAAGFFVGSVLPAIVSVASYVTSSLVPIFASVYQIIVSQVLPIVTRFAAFFVGTLLPAVLKIYQAVAANLKPVFDQLVATFQSRVLPTVQRLLAKFAEWQPTIQRVIAVVVKIIGKVAEFGAAILGKVLPPLIRFAGFLISNVVGAVSTVIGWVVKIVAKVLDFGGALVDGAGKAADFARKVKEKIGEAVGFVEGIPQKVKDAMSGAGTWLKDAGKKIIQGLIDGVTGMVGSLRDKFGEITDLIPDWKGPADRDATLLYPAGQLIMSGLIRGVDSKKKAVEKTFGDLTKEIGKGLDGLVSKVSKWGEKIDKALSLDKISKGTKKALQGVAGDLGKLETRLGKTVEALGTMKDAFASLKDSVAGAFKVDLFSSENLAGFMEAGTSANGTLTDMLKAFDTLKASGASKEFLAALFQSGNAALATELAASPQALADAQAVWQTQEDLAESLGLNVAEEVYGDDLATLQADLKALRTDVREAAKDAAREFAEAINEVARKSKKSKKKKK